MVVAVILILIVVGSVVFHFMSPWWWTPIASNWGYIDDTIIITFWITGTVFVAVILFMAYCVLKFQHKEGRRATYEPENKKLEWWLTGLTAIGVAGMLAPGLFVWNQYVSVPEDADVVEVLGQQWQWSYRYPGEDGVLGTSDARLIDSDNPFGVNPNDPNGQDDILVEGDDLHLPIDRPVKMLLRSIDVLHDFYVPQFRAKMDLVPGAVTFFWLTPTRTGAFDILCAELCGTGHHIMRGTVIVDNAAEYDEWMSEQETFAELAARAKAEEKQQAGLGTPTGDGFEKKVSLVVNEDTAKPIQ
ncbi:cytochrome c oxidase subunit II [Pelagibius sp. Alg239-R121]|uniref:cytochrome c oxidase subunit II n=1 Tax=Pelagibius sp. Alg239-R121 TaxID=2993448 RepID=UPI0024A611EF|nr:cytochrome c oxidase subunit II [Pelagibius sp. Alg239-R121]